MREIVQSVEAFMTAAQQTTLVFNERQASLYTGLQFEELAEKLEALGLNRTAQQLHALAVPFKDDRMEIAFINADRTALLDAEIDLAWVTIGAAFSAGSFVPGAVDEVARSNLAKINPATGTMDKDANGKVIKPAGWTAPNLQPFIQRK